MDLPVIMLVIWALSGLFSAVVAAALLTYVARTWQQIRSDREGSSADRILDAIDQVRVQLGSISDRIEEIEKRQLPPGDGGAPRGSTPEFPKGPPT